MLMRVREKRPGSANKKQQKKKKERKKEKKKKMASLRATDEM